MDGGAEAAAAAPLGAWASVRGFFTPATLFLVVNLVIGTIALTSRFHQRRRRVYHHHEEPPPPPPSQDEYYHGYFPPPQHYAPQQQPLARTSSVLDRLRSLGLYRFRSGDFPPEYAGAAASHADEQGVIPPADDEARMQRTAREQRRPAARVKKPSSEVRKAKVLRAPARVVEAPTPPALDEEEEDVVEFTPPQPELNYQEEYVPPPAPAPLARTPSMLDRLRSFGLYRFRSGDLAAEYAAPDAAAAQAEKAEQQAAHYDRSRSEPAKKKQAAAARMTKSSSEARKAAAVEEEGVDARADDFINKFRQQLQLQRLNSLLNYKEMLNRGGAKQ